MARRTATCVGGVLLVFFGLATTAFATTFYVTPGAVATPACPGPLLSGSIGAAVTAAGLVGSHTIKICAKPAPGYQENVAVPPRTGTLNFLGTGPGIVTVSGVPGMPGPIIGTDASGSVTIKNLTVNGGVGPGLELGCAAPGDIVWGIRLVNTNANISNVVVINARDPAGECQGVAISAEADTTSDRQLTVANSIIQNFNRAGISADGRVRANIHNNIVTGPLLPNIWAPDGIQISRGAVGSVNLNDIQDLRSPDPDAGAGSGINLYCLTRQTKVNRNSVDNADLGITISDTSKAVVSTNEVTDSGQAYSLQFIGDFFGPDTGCPPGPSITELNRITGNKATNSEFDGIALINFFPAFPLGVAQPRNNTISNNTINISGTDGIVLFLDEVGGLGPANNTITKNKISNSAFIDPLGFDAEDQTTGVKTSGTANTWTNNTCTTPVPNKDNPVGLCLP